VHVTEEQDASGADSRSADTSPLSVSKFEFLN